MKISILFGRWTVALRLFAAISALTACTAWAHKPSDSYLTLRIGQTNLHGEWHLALRDLDDAIGLDANDDGVITWQEVRAQQSALAAYALAHLQIGDAQQQGHLHVTELLVDRHSDGAYAVVRFLLEGFRPAADLQLQYGAFFDIDPLHRGLLRIEQATRTPIVAVFGPDSRSQHFALAQSAGTRAQGAFIREGVWHIWTGYDHILFLIALLLPGALRRCSGCWQPQSSVRPAVTEVMKTVTAFTLAHSLTLSLAAFDLVRLPSKAVECAIAGSIIVAAINNLVPLFAARGWVIAFAFGLLHGFGFAGALTDLGLHGGALVPVLFEFNVGVELGQLLIVGCVLPWVLVWRHRRSYCTRLLPIGSLAIGTVAAVWLAERTFEFRCLPF